MRVCVRVCPCVRVSVCVCVRVCAMSYLIIIWPKFTSICSREVDLQLIDFPLLIKVITHHVDRHNLGGYGGDCSDISDG